MSYNLKFSRYNKCSILIDWPSEIDENILNSILNFKTSILNHYSKQNVEVVNTYNSILVIYDVAVENINAEFKRLKSLFKLQDRIEKPEIKIWEIPVCYNEEYGIDLDNLALKKQCSKSEIITLHSKVIYTVFFIGFLPGFLYLGGLDPKLYFNRKSTPNLNIKKGAVAIGGQQTGIYPQNSPGGWHIIGQTPVTLFNVDHNPPCFVKAGDKLKFKSIDKLEFLKLKKRFAKDAFTPKFSSTNA
ncbi:5-oxoprolinase subunit PxpB [uncultured Winogradskyella sp.]|uniref:5-oxoprolinase subunit PxpB n=1 Tax=uncultured Winogradskyella sp. TaxID=395353 RepID=UPI002611DF5A|nr:5-oxoprolinase subunit PxpB [uncultured Winogradskyella sp.]